MCASARNVLRKTTIEYRYILWTGSLQFARGYIHKLSMPIRVYLSLAWWYMSNVSVVYVFHQLTSQPLARHGYLWEWGYNFGIFSWERLLSPSLLNLTVESIYACKWPCMQIVRRVEHNVRNGVVYQQLFICEIWYAGVKQTTNYAYDSALSAKKGNRQYI